MRKTITVEGKRYRAVPWHSPDAGSSQECTGCAFEFGGCVNGTDEHGDICDDGNDFGGMVLIPATKQGMADYIAVRLGATDEPKDSDD